MKESMGKIPLTNALSTTDISKLKIYSFDGAIYHASIVLAQGEFFIDSNDGKLLKARSLMEMRKLGAGVDSKETSLIQQSAYDEMIGQPTRTAANTLDVQLVNLN